MLTFVFWKPGNDTHIETDVETENVELILDHQSTEIKKLDAQTVLELEAAAFRRLVAHLDENKDVQNIDLMNLASFCRNCLSKWYKSAAEDKGIALEYEEVRERIYGIPYADWKKQHQSEATAEQLKAFDEKHPWYRIY